MRKQDWENRVIEVPTQKYWQMHCALEEERSENNRLRRRLAKLKAVVEAAESVKAYFQICHGECFSFQEQGCPYRKSDKCWPAELFKALEALDKEE